MDQLSYALGVLLAQNLQNQGFDNLDEASMNAAIHDVLAGNEPKLTPEEANKVIQDYMQEKQKAQHADAIKKGEDFLAENAKREGIKVTESGLQYEVLKEGTGEKPSASSKVSVHYHGTLIDGTVFDSSVERGEPTSFGVNQVIKGWTEALQLMPQGSKWKLYIPADLAYGPRGAGGKIGPYETLIFEVELLEIQ
ncbi:MAG: FKBP-type peptidyl-prolyl cis-trans isomerase [Mameliella sp.]|nr:FKBP-type peptidyl-prolyl cis-trans isomerase [Phaeodactylibacter sp.]NRA51455.1 FKBP-type peptidyl-prolyl cis-trans isomerase [Phaeodactylibacter sp.]